MINKILDLFKKPVTSTNEIAEKATLKSSFIYVAIFSGIIAICNLITSFFGQVIVSKYDYTARKVVKQFTFDNFDFGKLISGAIGTFFAIALVMIIIATIMYVISRILKNNNDYSKMLTIAVVSFSPVAVAMVFAVLTSWLYAPLSVFAYVAAGVYASYTMIFAFRNTLTIENENKLVILYVCIVTGIFIVAYYILSSMVTDAISNLMKF